MKLLKFKVNGKQELLLNATELVSIRNCGTNDVELVTTKQTLQIQDSYDNVVEDLKNQLYPTSRRVELAEQELQAGRINTPEQYFDIINNGTGVK